MIIFGHPINQAKMKRKLLNFYYNNRFWIKLVGFLLIGFLLFGCSNTEFDPKTFTIKKIITFNKK